MFLALDAGNSNLTAGLFAGEEIVGRWRMTTRRDATSDELGVWLWAALQASGLGAAKVRGIAFCSVVPTLTVPIHQLARDYFKVEALGVGSEIAGLQNGCDDPGAVGADRLVNGLMAWKMAGRAVVVADFGTATTVDAVSADGVFLGGAIAPGLGVSSEALFRAGAKLPRVALVAPSQTLATNTQEALQAGLVFGYAGLVKELVGRAVGEMETRFGASPAVYATGGLGQVIAPLVPQIERVEIDLTLRGLRLLWEQA